MTRKGNDEESFIDKVKDAFDGDDKKQQKSKDGHVIEREFENTPDEGKEDVPTEDKLIRDPKTGEETFIKNDNKKWKMK